MRREKQKIIIKVTSLNKWVKILHTKIYRCSEANNYKFLRRTNKSITRKKKLAKKIKCKTW